MPSQLIFITGVAGYLGAHIVHQLLQAGYRVRGTARGAKVSQVKAFYAPYGEQFEVVDVNDIAVDDISTHLKGVDAVIHSAAPLANRPDLQEIMNGAIEGSINIIRQAEKAGVTKIIYTSTIATVLNPSGALNEKGNPINDVETTGPILTADDFNPITKEQALKAGDPFSAYVAGKTLAEKAVWDLAEAHPQLDITTFNAPYYFGPYAPGFSVPEPHIPALSTTAYIYRMLTPTGSFPSVGFVDVRDLARAHVAALTPPPTHITARKRLIIASPYDFDYKDAVAYIAEQRPELRSRLVTDLSNAPEHANVRLDLSRLEQVTGIKAETFKTWQETILDTVDALIALEKDWVSKGFTLGK